MVTDVRIITLPEYDVLTYELPDIVALIPARARSKRIKGKNIKPLNGRPLMAYTIKAALDSKIFKDVIVSTDSTKYADIAIKYGAEVVMRPPEFATDISPDIEWVEFTLRNDSYDCFSILRPTSPFRTADTIKRAWRDFLKEDVDSLRAVELCAQHPCKMWHVKGNRMMPLYPEKHSQPYQTLPIIHVQNASLEIAWTRVLKENSISGFYVMPFFTQDYEGFDINSPIDWQIAKWLLRTGKVKLPRI